MKNFFGSLDQRVLNQILQRYLDQHYAHQQPLQQELSWLIKKIVFHNPTSNYQLNGSPNLHRQVPKHKSLFNQPKYKGLPIGNLTSQFFANVYLDKLDQFAKRKLKVKYYLRYADDLILLSQNKQQLKTWHKQINLFVQQKLKLKLNPSKTKLKSIYQGINFVGYIITKNRSYVRKRTVTKLKTQLKYFNQGMLWVNNNTRQEAVALGKRPTQEQLEYLLMSINSCYGHFLQANSYNLRKHLYQEHFGQLQQYLKPVKNYRHFIRYDSR